LAIARGIVQAHGGNIQVQSHIGQGTQFTFYIP
jgi:signal transduction histidine kinase